MTAGVGDLRETADAGKLGRRQQKGGRAGPQVPLGSRVGALTFLFIVTIYFLVPVYWVVISSTKGTADLFGSFGLWFSHPQWIANLAHTFTYDGGIYLRWLVNSIVYAGVGSLVATLFAAAAGYALSKYDFRGREFVFSVILAGVMVPPTAIALPLYLMMSGVGLNNSYWSVLLPSMVSPFGAYLARIYAASAVPDEVIDAARVDGASEFRIFSRIALKIMSPALVTIFLFQLVAIWNNYFLPLVMLSNQKLYPIILGLTLWNSQTQRTPQLYALTVTGAFVSVVLLVGAIVSLQRYWKGGLTAGSIR